MLKEKKNGIFRIKPQLKQNIIAKYLKKND